VLVELADYGDRAEEAGLQRLLQSAGYDINVIDGYAGRRTRRQIAAFEAISTAAFGADRSELIEALHQRALERNSGWAFRSAMTPAARRRRGGAGDRRRL
jgi:hypothetical protein